MGIAGWNSIWRRAGLKAKHTTFAVEMLINLSASGALMNSRPSASFTCVHRRLARRERNTLLCVPANHVHQQQQSLKTLSPRHAPVSLGVYLSCSGLYFDALASAILHVEALKRLLKLHHAIHTPPLHLG